MLKVWLKPHYFVCLLDIKLKLCSSLGVIAAPFELESHSLLCFFFQLEQLHLVGGGKPLGQYSYWSKYVLWHCTAIGLSPYTPNRVKTICWFTKSMANCLFNWAVSSQCFFGMEQIMGTYAFILCMWLVTASLRSQDLEKHNFLLPMIQSIFLFLLLESGMYRLCPQSFNRHSQVTNTHTLWNLEH